MEKSLAELAQFVQGKVIGEGRTLISGVTSADHLVAGHLAFLEDSKRLAHLESSPIAALIVPTQIESSTKPLIQVAQPKAAWAQLLALFSPPRTFSGTISPQASIAPSARLGPGVTVEPFACVGEEVEIGAGSVIRAHSCVDRRVKIGEKTLVHPHVTIYENALIGSRCILHAGSVIGADGFGYVATPQGQVKVPQVGNVVIEDEVEIGACTTIDRATVGSTRIGRGAKIDNQVQIAHNVLIGPHTVISAQTGISGSTVVGAFVTLGGHVGLGDHVQIGDQTMLGAGTGVPTGKKIPPKQIWFGTPARPYHQMRKQLGAELRLPEMLEEVRKLRSRVEELEKQLREKGEKGTVPF